MPSTNKSFEHYHHYFLSANVPPKIQKFPNSAIVQKFEKLWKIVSTN